MTTQVVVILDIDILSNQSLAFVVIPRPTVVCMINFTLPYCTRHYPTHFEKSCQISSP